MTKNEKKEQIINEYYHGLGSFRELEIRHRINYMNIYRWVKEFQKANPSIKPKPRQIILPEMITNYDYSPENIALLKSQLAEEKLRNKLLNTMFELAENELKIPLRKKYGTKL